ncbi:unnamed protein product [Choristocarpus tenellus]
MSLVGDYGGSSDEGESSGDEEKKTFSEESKVTLPSAADLFDSVDSASFMPATISAPLPNPIVKKRKGPGKGGEVSGGTIGKSGIGSSNVTNLNSKSQGMIPPQMSRPNIVTEDVGAWSSDVSVKRQKQLETEKRSSDAKAKVDGKNFKQREKEKRDKGQASRGKSYVEEEKRILREMGGGI